MTRLPPDYKLGEMAYELYGEDAGYKTYNDKPMPEWEDIGPTVQQHWAFVAANLFPTDQDWRYLLEPREVKILENAINYAQDAFGDNGHALKLVLAKVARVTDLAFAQIREDQVTEKEVSDDC